MKKTTKKVAPKPASKPAKKTRKPRASVSEMARRELATIEQRADKLKQYLSLGDELFGSQAVKSVVTKEPKDASKSKRTQPTLEVVFRKVLSKAGKITLEDACTAVLDSGYTTKSDNFLPCVQQLAHKMLNAKSLVVAGRDGRKNLYALKAA